MKLTFYLPIAMILLTIPIIFTGCYDNDDFAPYSHYTEEIDNIYTNGEVTSLYDVIPSANEVVERYDQGLILTKIILITDDSGLTGDIQISYAKVHEDRNQVTCVILHFDIESKTFYNVEYEQGHGKRVSIISEQLSDKYLNMSFQELFELEETKNKSDKKYVKINCIRDEMYVTFVNVRR